MPRDLDASEVHTESDADCEGPGGVSSCPLSAPKKPSGLMGHLTTLLFLRHPTGCPFLPPVSR